MKKVLAKISLAAVAAISLNAQVINLNQGWNNIGIVNETPLMDFNNSNIRFIWQYSNGQWNVYTPNSELMQQIREDVESGNVPYGIIPSSLPSGSALWIYSDEGTQLRVGEEAVFTSVNGVVKDALTNDLISSFTIILDGSQEYTFDNNGTFYLNNISLGEHNLTIYADGYRDLTVNLDLENPTPLDLAQLQLVPDTATVDINVSGRVVDATTGQPISGARLRMIPGYNNENGEPVVDVVLTDGSYSVEIPAGPYTVLIDANGYYSTSYNYTFAVDENESSYISQDFALAPEQSVSTDSVMRAILTWRETPRDLDSHLVAYDDATQSVKWHVYYEYRDSGEANLDVDDTSSYGPETITLVDLNSSLKYKYFVYNYSNEEALKNSNAHLVVIYNGREYEFQVPNEDGRVWKVFEIDNGVLVPCIENCMYDSYSTDYDFISSMRETNEEDTKSLSEIVESYEKNPK